MKSGRSVAIVGVGALFPGSPTPERFWDTITGNRDTSGEPPPGRWLLSPDECFSAQPGAPDRVYARKGCFLSAEDTALDPAGCATPEELLNALDPMFHLLLKTGRQLTEGLNLERINLQRTGVIIGNLALPTEKSSALAREYLGRTFIEQLGHPALTGSHPPTTHPLNACVAGLPAGLLARELGLQGTCFTLDAACASSLYAVKLAADEILAGRADAMVAGGLSRPDALYTQMGFSQLRALSPNGRCAPFSVHGDGLVVGEGCGLVMLKETAAAIRDGDDIHGVIRGIGLSNDLEGNLLAPASEGQLRAMRAAYRQAGWQPSDIDLVECHATGTPVGDAVEFNSLCDLWQDQRWRPGQCVIGSVKANIGHLLTAAGSAALIKVLLAIRHRTLPPMVHFDEPAPDLDYDASPFRVLKRPLRWEERSHGRPRRAAVSAFGFGGINAHLLIEEWSPKEKKPRQVTSHPTFRHQQQPIAVVGMAGRFGPWNDTDALRERVCGTGSDHSPQAFDRWWGTQHSEWFQSSPFGRIGGTGYLLDQVSTRPGEFRIPPRELEEMLPRQLLMLQIAARALQEAQVNREDLLFTGVFIGAGLDLNATNFSFRWGLEKEARQWLEQLGSKMSEETFRAWVNDLRQAAGPALTANRTMGALGSVVASRIAKEFHIGGPSFTLSSEDNSGLRALEVGMHALQEGSINRALVGAVDLGGDLRSLFARHSLRPLTTGTRTRPFDKDADGSLIGEGAAAVVLKRLDDARQDGDRILGVLRGIGTALSLDNEPFGVASATYQRSLESALAAGRVDPATFGYLEADGSGIPELDSLEAETLSRSLAVEPKNPCYYGTVKADIGHCGAAAGLAALLKILLSMNSRVLPPVRGLQEPIHQWTRTGRSFLPPTGHQFWLHNRKAGPRRALIAGIGLDGSCSHAVVEEPPHSSSRAHAAMTTNSAMQMRECLLACTAETADDLAQQLADLDTFLRRQPEQPLTDRARRWLQDRPLDPRAPLAISLIAEDDAQLYRQIDQARRRLQGHPETPIGRSTELLIDPDMRDRVFYSPRPLHFEGDIAFVFPGSGNHFAQMGQELSALWPQVYQEQLEHSQYLADQFLPEQIWVPRLSEAFLNDHNALVISHVALCTAFSDLLQGFGIKPRMISGYSLGEAAGLFAGGAWRDRDGMLKRLSESPLFSQDLAGECRAARRTWGFSRTDPVDWQLGIVDLPADQVRAALKGRRHVYLLIINTYRESVIGGLRSAVESLIADLGCHFIPLQGVTTVHCEVVHAVADAYRRLHLFPVTPPPGVDYYSCALGRKYPLNSENAADVILAQATDTIDYPRVIEQLYADGARIFLEAGPGASCTRMIDSVLGAQRPHLCRTLGHPNQDGSGQLLRLLGQCLAERVAVDLSPLYPEKTDQIPEPQQTSNPIAPAIGGPAFQSPPIPETEGVPDSSETIFNNQDEVLTAADSSRFSSADGTFDRSTVLNGFEAVMEQHGRAHQAFLNFSRDLENAFNSTVSLQMSLLQRLHERGGEIPPINMPTSIAKPLPPTAEQPQPVPPETPVAFDRNMCLEFAVGSVGRMLGPEFAEIDSFPTRVRLPDEPLMLVDRILEVEGEPRSLSRGRVVTEHDVTTDRWYLDGGRIPTCIAVEAGQADLFLSGYLGIDFTHQGHAVYRLLDAVVTFHRGLPVPGETIRYDIRIERFFRQGQTYLFHFNFEGSVNGQPLLSMQNGCAGFFTAAELAAGRGIVKSRLDQRPRSGTLPDDWQNPIAMVEESYNDQQIEALYAGDLSGCFGPTFSGLALEHPNTLPGGRLKLVDRVTRLEPQGGRYGLGQITAEMDIDPHDWFLTCHFVDDRVMPGTLMYECCMHTLRIFLLRMGWIGEIRHSWYEPLPGVASGLKCRGQVVETTRVVTYQVEIKELGYAPEPFAIVDALMFADGQPIVEIPDMSLRISGLNRDKIERLWAQRIDTAAPPQEAQVLYDRPRITAFAVGNPSDAFGEPYRIFDQERKIARLPGPPFQFLDRIVGLQGEPWVLKEGARATAEYDVPSDAWYFAADRQPTMPFSVLLEVGLQPCGWLAAYLGSALTSDDDLSFRNLDGTARLYRSVGPDSGTLRTSTQITKIVSSGGMLIQHYDFSVSDAEGPVYSGTTVFGFFPAAALAQQVGVRDATPYNPDERDRRSGQSFNVPRGAPFPETMLRMVEDIEIYAPQGGSSGLGFIRGSKPVDPTEWFFQAHFYQDPVCPGSLGLESLLQLLKVVAADHWQCNSASRFITMPGGREHRWNYRGQIIPDNHRVVIEADITAVDDRTQTLVADGYLSVDGKIIYRMQDFSLRLIS